METAQINLSLLMLGNVISRLAEGRQRAWLPFRNSKLTRLLQTTLGGNARAVFVATIHPGVEHAEETASTLRFMSRAMQVPFAATFSSAPESQICTVLLVYHGATAAAEHREHAAWFSTLVHPCRFRHCNKCATRTCLSNACHGAGREHLHGERAAK